ncbi:uncharacterized protein LOC143293875 [Babylonia areolata]|uniref:uncharacterized protein LOC143293875 n=1 Tax=Babylonia areolata TaxID=304850 RepID=UPI003FD4C5D9
MAQGEEDIEEEYLTCYICYEVFTEPKTLTCLHRFCEKCLEGYLVGLSESTTRKKSFPCPVCRESNPAPDPQRPAADWASLLRTDFHLKNLIKALTAQGTARGGKGKGSSSPCDLHDKEQDLFCVDCSRSICHLCAGITHRGCAQVITLNQAATDRRATVHLHCRQLTDRLDSLAQLRAQIDSAADSLVEQHQKAEASIHQSSEARVTAIRLQEMEQVRELHRTFRTLQQDLGTRLETLDRRMKECRQVVDTVQGQMKSASDADVMQKASVFLGHNALDFADEKKKAHSILMRLKSIRLDFHPLPPNAHAKLGDLSLTFRPKRDPTSTMMAPSTTTSTPSDSAKPRPAQPQYPQLPPRRLRSQSVPTMAETPEEPVKVRVIPGTFRDDQHSPKLRDVLVLPGKMVLVTDWANQCVKAFHERRDRDSRLSVGGKPWCLARVSDTTVAVSLPVSSQICVLKVTPRLMLQSSFFTEKRYSGLAALNSDNLVASGGSDPPCVDVINLGGEVLRSFSHDVSTGRQLFLYPARIAMMPDRKQFVVSDRDRAALICLTSSGQVRFVLQPEGSKSLQEPSGVRVDSTGDMYVAEARGVVKVTDQGIRALLKSSQDGLQEPRGMDLDEDGLLYVTSREEEVVVFKI